jgi:Ni,Fe-hydrogenase I cytochrome b subunit
MFDSLADRIREDEQVSASQRYIRWVAILVISIVLFGGLYFGVSFLNNA